MRTAEGRLRVSGAKSAVLASRCGCLRVGSWRLRLPCGFHRDDALVDRGLTPATHSWVRCRGG
jgi:hypothetical protein